MSMKKRPKRKIVLFLVEGRSERKALEIAISELYDQVDENIEVFFPIIRTKKEERGGDITSTFYLDKLGRKHWIHPNNIEDAIYYMFLEDFFDENKIMPKDITEIVHIVDTDGAFISEDMVQLCDKNLDKPFYTGNEIKCTNVESIRNRNAQKSNNLNYLIGCNTIKIKQKTVPYSIYYFSCNLDHFLHNSQNLDDKMKCSLANNFARDYIGIPEEFVKKISNDPRAIHGMNYAESWEYIQQGNNSLQRHTNINLLLEKLLEKIKKN